MATSAIGPGFLTQTSLFTSQALASFGFVILVSILLDIGAQMNIWRIVTASGARAQDITNRVLPGMGHALAALVAFGGFVFNMGNLAGCGLGLEVMTGLDPRMGAILSSTIALFIFWYRDAGRLMDHVTRFLGIVMILATLYIVVYSSPPLAEAAYRSIWPESVDTTMIVTIVGGTVGGYISFAGAHRLLEAGIRGKEMVPLASVSAVRGILFTSLMRYLLFLAVLGVVSQGVALQASNPAATAFQSAAGRTGYLFFGLVIWSAGITSVVGASFTSVSFWKTLSPAVAANQRLATGLFIIVATGLFVWIGSPVKLLVFAGALNGLILPVALAMILLAARRKRITNGYEHSVFWQVVGWIVVFIMSWMGVRVIGKYLADRI